MGIKSIEVWSRSRQFRAKKNFRRFNYNTESGKISKEYYDLMALCLTSPVMAFELLLKNANELKK